MKKQQQSDYEIISLGQACLTRTFLTHGNLIPNKALGRKSMIFDLVPNPTYVIAQCIKDDFSGYFDDFEFAYHPVNRQNYWLNKKYGVYYVHDRDCKDNFKKFKKRYQTRIDNFKEALNNKKFTYFVHAPKAYTDIDRNLIEDINTLYDELKNVRGEKPFKLIIWDLLDIVKEDLRPEISVIRDFHPNKDADDWWDVSKRTEDVEIWKQKLLKDTEKEIEKGGFKIEYYKNEPHKTCFIKSLFENKKLISLAQNIFKIENDHDNNRKILILLGLTFKLKNLHPFNYSDIIIKIDGRMGNQMFQWAFGRAYEAQNGNLPIFDDSKETLKLDCFKMSKEIKTIRKPFWNRILRKIIPFRNLRNKITELKLTMPHYEEQVMCLYQPDLFDVISPAYIFGYFQSEKYFEQVREQLLKDFQLIKPLNEANKEILEKIKNTNSVSIHFRRGDFLKSRVAAHFGNLGEQYYHDAIKYISEHTSEPLTLFVFSDDVNWVRENVKFGHETIYVDVNSGKQGYFDLDLMKNCKHNIIANSSFSWWGGWLNENPDKIVVAPSPVRPHQPDYDRLPDDWVKCNPYFS